MNLLEELQKSEKFKDLKVKFGSTEIPILCSNINPEIDLSFLNMWRPILRQLLAHYCKKKGTPKSKVVDILLNSTSNIAG